MQGLQARFDQAKNKANQYREQILTDKQALSDTTRISNDSSTYITLV